MGKTNSSSAADIKTPNSIELLTPFWLYNIAKNYGLRISIEVNYNSKTPKAYVILFKNWGTNIGSRTKKIDINIDRIPFLTVQEILTHVNQFLHPVLGF
jgi:hypothetical protein